MSEQQAPPFRFSPRPNQAHQIRWRPWGPEAFREAQETGKPILLSLSAVWCHWCHVMDETSYSDPGVIAYINEHYIPIRVDNDQRPDINARYNMGGWPTTAFLTPEGEVLAGATYLAPEQMLELLPQIAAYYRSNREEVARRVEELRRQRAALAAGRRGQISVDILPNVLRALVEVYDPLFGGFGDAPKFPHPEGIDLLLYAYRRWREPELLQMAAKSLESMAQGQVFDQEWGGFFRYATRRDWSQPHYEKMLEDNAGLLRNLLSLYRLSGQESHARTAQRVIDYLESSLRDREAGFFYGSQDADEEFYQLPAAQREKRPQPHIDRTCYTAWNAMAASAYLEAAWTLERPELAQAALSALSFAWERCREPGRGMYRFNDGTPQVLGLLADQAYTARALLDAYEVTADPLHLERARELGRFILNRFADEQGGGFFDIWDEVEGLGRLSERAKSIQENALCAEVFTRLHHLTREEGYRQAAESALEAFAPTYHVFEHYGAAYGQQVDTFLNPPAEITIVGDAAEEATRSLQRAALALDVPARIVQVLHPRRDAARLEALSLPPEPAPAAYVCLGTMCSAPLARPEELLETVRAMQQSAGLS